MWDCIVNTSFVNKSIRIFSDEEPEPRPAFPSFFVCKYPRIHLFCSLVNYFKHAYMKFNVENMTCVHLARSVATGILCVWGKYNADSFCRHVVYLVQELEVREQFFKSCSHIQVSSIKICWHKRLALAPHEISHNRYVYKDFVTLISDCVSELIVIITGMAFG